MDRASDLEETYKHPEADLRALGAVKFVMKGRAIIKGTQ
jgi:hypothetical protein